MGKVCSVNTIGIVIVSYGHEADVQRCVESFLPQLGNDDRVVIVDNKKPWVFSNTVSFEDPRIQIINHDNGGFAAGCNEGARKLDTDIVFLLNPDTVVEDPHLLESMREMTDTEYAAWMPYLLLADTGKVNSAGNALHISGLSWVNGLESEPDYTAGISDIAIASGACLAVKKQWWDKLGGMEEHYFMYHEDTDFSARIVLAGGRIGLVHKAYVNHHYDYGKGDHKWIYMERNRILFALGTWPAPVVAVLLPQLLGVEAGLWLIAAKDKRLGLKVRSLAATITGLRAIPQMRKNAAEQTKIGPTEFYRHMSWQLDNPNLGLADATAVQRLYKAYYKLAGAILGFVASSR